jgi:hypothetical protein
MTTLKTLCTFLDCGHVLPLLPSPGGTGYALDRETERTSCYPCAEESERQAFSTADTWTAYIDGQGLHATTWTGAHLARVVRHTVSRNGWQGSQIHAWGFVDLAGAYWHGRNAGPGMVITVRRAKS